MKNRWQLPDFRKLLNKEQGQSVALVAMMFVGLLGIVGISVDVGFVFARQSQLNAAVDSGVLAGVTELTGPGRLPFANERAAEFLHTHNLPASVITTTFDNPANYAQSLTILGERQYSLTVTWPVDLFFLRVVGIDDIDVTETATAAHFPLADIYASRRVEDGALSTSNQGVFGPHICVDYGDPFSATIDPDGEVFRETWRGDPNDRTYHYRILIPESYPDDVVRVELYDPDSINQPNNDGGSYTDQVAHTNIAINNGMPPVETLSCSQNHKNPCLIPTGEDSLGLDLDRVNLWWFARSDENRGSGTAPGNGNCGEPSSYNVGFNTITYYELFYYKESSDGVIVKTPLAWYYGQSGDMVMSRGGFARDLTFSGYNHDTDLRWVTPGGQLSFDQSVTVPTGCGSPNGGDFDPDTCPGGSMAGPGSGFEVNLNDDVVDILVDPNNGNRYLYLDVTTLSGSSENGFEIWAGPNDYVATLPSNVNARNIEVINDPSSHTSEGATVFGLGHLPMNSNFANRIDIPLVYLGPQYAGADVFVSQYDSDSGADPPIHFFFDSISRSDYEKTFSDPPNPDPDGQTGRCVIGSCGTQFITPPYQISIPTLADSCTNPGDPAQMDICNPYYGGRLTASYDGGLNDTYHWNITLNGLPYLVR